MGMTFLVAEDCLRLGLRAGAMIFRNLRIAPSDPDQRAEIAKEAALVRSRYSDIAAIRAHPLVAGFHAISQQVRAHPKTDRCSLEKLLTFAFKRGDLPQINNLVDAYNLVSIRTSCSLGAHDLDKIALPVSLRLLDGSESFTPLGSDHAIATKAGEFGYVDAANRLLCRLDVLQADFSKVTEMTVNALIIVEGTTAQSAQLMWQAFVDLAELVPRFCGGTGEMVAGSAE
jgi:DNA/RNA-binding domain of Phe-tRNA-synthetase-like protein